MTIDSHFAVIDNDFVNKLTDSSIDDPTLVSVLKLVFSDLEITVLIHPLVYEYELMPDNKRIKLLIGNVIHKAEFSDIFQGSDEKKAYYIFLVTELFKKLTGKALSASGENVLHYWIRKSSLGEVHSVSMCLVCNTGIFLSDDNDSKRLQFFVKHMNLGNIHVYNRTEFFEKHLQEGINKLPRSVKRWLTHMK